MSVERARSDRCRAECLRVECARVDGANFSCPNARSSNESRWECTETEARGDAKGSLVYMYSSVGVIGDSGLCTRRLSMSLYVGLRNRSLWTVIRGVIGSATAPGDAGAEVDGGSSLV